MLFSQKFPINTIKLFIVTKFTLYFQTVVANFGNICYNSKGLRHIRCFYIIVLCGNDGEFR